MLSRTRIKICGITSMDTAAEAVEAGVDALGFIFAAHSPRKIAPENARDIIARLPPFVTAVGVFVNEDQETVEKISRYCRLVAVQLHGDETPGYCAAITSTRVIKAFRLSTNAKTIGNEPDYQAYSQVVAGYLLDTFHEKMAGGTGQIFDWRILERIRPPGPIYLAGGLTVDNVGEAIRRIRPFAVDVNSGVEIAPGKKDLHKIKRFIAEVCRADTSLAPLSSPDCSKNQKEKNPS